MVVSGGRDRDASSRSRPCSSSLVTCRDRDAATTQRSADVELLYDERVDSMCHVRASGIRFLVVPVFGAILLLPGCGLGGVDNSSTASDTGHNPQMVAAIQQNRQLAERNQWCCIRKP